MTEEQAGNRWSKWLQEKLDERGWRQADLVNNSEGHIKRDRASKWVRGVETPTWRMAKVAANTLGVPQSEALRAAGFENEASEMDRQKSVLKQHLGIKGMTDGQLVETLKEVPDSAILRVLQLRAAKRESLSRRATGVAQGNYDNLIVGGFGQNAEPTDLERAAFEDDGDDGADLTE